MPTVMYSTATDNHSTYRDYSENIAKLQRISLLGDNWDGYGAERIHRNKIEHKILTGRHIHIATERYIRKGLDAEGFAIEAENEYNNFESAFDCLIRKCNIILVGLDLFNIVN